jgi:hypothetical protein
MTSLRDQAAPEHFSDSLQVLSLSPALNWTRFSLAALSRLKHLVSIVNVKPNMLESLPESLTSVRMTTSDVKVESLKKLPKHLKLFDCYKITGDLSRFDFWPSALTHLSFCLPSSVPFASKDARWLSLPKTLTYLRASYQGNYLPIHPNFLPPLLNQVSAVYYRIENEIFDYSHLGQLRQLDLRIYHPKADNRVLPTNPESEGDSMNQDLATLSVVSSAAPPCFQFILPAKLTTFQWMRHERTDFEEPMPDNSFFRDFFASWLPESLTRFDCNDTRLLTDKFFSNLPSSLLELNLSLQEKDCHSMFSSDAFKSLPPRLTRLVTAVDANADDSFIAFLPRSLVELSMSRLRILHDSNVEHLPRGLKYLHLRHVEIGMTDSCIPYLPRSLERLELEHNKTLTPEALFAQKFPKLTHVDFRANPNWRKSRTLRLAPAGFSIKGKQFARIKPL